jgi:hypothetical protein
VTEYNGDIIATTVRAITNALRNPRYNCPRRSNIAAAMMRKLAELEGRTFAQVRKEFPAFNDKRGMARLSSGERRRNGESHAQQARRNGRKAARQMVQKQQTRPVWEDFHDA